ncbi:hypothetical protein [Flavivirga jejuensis]|uniref:Uncharacterized protein n=1 Tax=Flavivirga jejuensis TaxID=870487 RepID=A0ABT8WN44_9FLAO|nr:hypothetical protein [Flavivirga jejuensis]MDO5974409.1 hypothetical protein [Flavivirga jejuensis]
MKKAVALICALMLGVYSFAQTQKKEESKFNNLVKQIRWSVDVLPFTRITKFDEDTGGLNPQNRIARLDKYNGGLYLRPDLKFKNKAFSFFLKPRFNTDWREQKGMETEFYFQQAKLKMQLNDAFYITGGQYIKSIGTSVYVNPSNPYFLESGRLNPKIELRPMNFVELNFTKENWDFTLISNVHEGEAELFDFPFFEFKRQHGLLVEYYGESQTIGTIVSISEDERYHLGFYGQRNLNDATLVWFDGAVNYNPNRFYPVEGHSTELLPFEMVNGDENKNYFFSGLVGASYTFSFGPTLNLEYYYNGKGYDDKTFDLYKETVVAGSLSNFDVIFDLSNLNLGRAANTGMPYLRRNYIFSQIGENDVFGELNYNFRYFYSIDDQSSQFSSLIEWNALDNLEIFSVFIANIGEKTSSFNNLLNNQLMLGTIWKF